tara:strand:- start:219 stop:851 length:633 start_codon:yes stop_codon:yes gene_type:complete
MSNKKQRLARRDTRGGLSGGGMQHGKNIGNILSSLEEERNNGNGTQSSSNGFYVGKTFHLEFPEYTKKGEPFVRLNEEGNKFTGIIRDLNPRAIKSSMMYNVVAYEIDKKRKIINFTEALYTGDQIHIRADKISEKPGKLEGKFLKYDVYIDQTNDEGLEVNPGDYLYGMVKRLRESNNGSLPRVMLRPTKLIKQRRYEKFNGTILENQH